MAVPVALFLVAFICTHHTSQLLVSATYCPATERQALAELKTNTIDPAGRLSSWTGTDCCQWDGVRCDNQTGHVVSVDLQNLHVYYEDDEHVIGNSSWALEFGLLSPSLLSLNHLLHLDLSGNYFQFPAIPQFLGSFQDLRYLNLSITNMKGTIPHQLGNLSSLHTLSLLVNEDDDEATSLALDDPWWISGLTSLQHFEIRSASLGHGWIQALNMLSSLRQIRVSRCDLRGSRSLPLVNFTSLEVLDLSQNHGLTSAILTWLPNLTRLQFLGLDDNDIQGFLPIAIWNFSSLEVIDMSGNDITGTIPEMAGNLRRLQSLDLSNSKITGRLPFNIGNMASLEHLYLDGNSISGAIPASIGNLTHLRKLSIRDNILNGRIPESIGKLHRLRWLDISNNTLSGPIPVSITNLSSLEQFVLSANRLTGTIPQSLGQLSNLYRLDLSANRLNGTIPQSLEQLSNLGLLDLSDNSLAGVVTESHFASLAKLLELSMSRNSMIDLQIISGWRPPFQLTFLKLAGCRVGPQFPGWLRTQRNIFYLDLSNARISDSLPDWLWSKRSVFYFFLLSNNNLTGTISSSLCEMGPAVLDLSSTQLTGQLPNCSISQDGNVLDVSNNNLSGDIPDAFLSSNFEYLYLSSNNFTGEVPTILKQSKEYMSVLDLGNNRFRGNVPIWLDESFTSLRILRLRSNMLTGSLPTETLSRVPNLQILDLSHNNLSGVIPKSFGNLTAMMRQNDEDYITGTQALDQDEGYTNTVLLDIKGRDLEYGDLLRFLTAIDLSDNNLSGAIPEELGNLSWLQSLNVSGNCLTGEITAIIGGMQMLESLDLSRNEFSGPLPQSLANLNSLGFLNVSYNNFSGRIPSGGHIDTFDDPSVYMGNPYLVPAEYNHDNQTDHGENEDDDNNRDEMLWLYAGLAPGFAVGLCILCGVLVFKETWRRAYFQTVDCVCDYVNAVIHLRKLRRIERVHD